MTNLNPGFPEPNRDCKVRSWNQTGLVDCLEPCPGGKFLSKKFPKLSLLSFCGKNVGQCFYLKTKGIVGIIASRCTASVFFIFFLSCWK